jgi:hypothetical protein
MFRHHGRLLVLVLALAAAAAPAAANARADLDFPIDGCVSAQPDAIVYVLGGFAGADSKSGSGSYFYRTSGSLLVTPCNYWVTDVKMATYSPSVSLSGAAWDLPSSASFGGATPGTAEDCNRFTLAVRYYRKLASESAFTSVGAGTAKGQWAGSCTLVWNGPSSYQAAPSQSGWDTYRVAVRVKLRSSGQEVRSVIALPPAIPN